MWYLLHLALGVKYEVLNDLIDCKNGYKEAIQLPNLQRASGNDKKYSLQLYFIFPKVNN